jgi:hypothetical protein
MEGPVEGDDLPLPALEAGHLDGDLHRFRARVAELNLPGQGPGRELDDALGEGRVDRIGGSYNLEKLASLIAARGDDLRLAIPRDGRPETGHEVGKGASIGIQDAWALTPFFANRLGTEDERGISRRLLRPRHRKEALALSARARRGQLRRLRPEPSGRGIDYSSPPLIVAMTKV